MKYEQVLSRMPTGASKEHVRSYRSYTTPPVAPQMAVTRWSTPRSFHPDGQLGGVQGPLLVAHENMTVVAPDP
ncbi:MAG: hypothetical protein V4760_13855, partial [Bdellovibrionota bacterium]